MNCEGASESSWLRANVLHFCASLLATVTGKGDQPMQPARLWPGESGNRLEAASRRSTRLIIAETTLPRLHEYLTLRLALHYANCIAEFAKPLQVAWKAIWGGASVSASCQLGG